MKNILIISALIILSKFELYPQGFDWQLSPRLPAKYSDLFLGVASNYNLTSESGKFDYYEDNCNCGKFENGDGHGYSFGVASEYWLSDGQTSLRAEVKYSLHSPMFAANQSLPIILNSGEESLIHYRNTFESKLEWVAISAGAKERLLGTFFYAGLDLQFAFLLKNFEKHIEEITAPSYAPPFPTNPPSFKRLVSEGKIEDVRPFSLSTAFSIGYDLDLGIGSYVSPYFSISYNFTDMISKGNWKSLQYGIGLKVMRWIN